MVLSMDRWKGKVAIVTGSNSGIGQAIALKLLAQGLIVAAFDRQIDKIQQSPNLQALKTDLTSEKQILESFQWVSENLGPVHILINCAGVTNQGPLIIESETQGLRHVLEVNVLGLTIATREAVKIMRENNISGHVININSVVGHNVPLVTGFNMYSPSKFAVTALTETVRVELNSIKSRIKISSISPGTTTSGLTTLGHNQAALNFFGGLPTLEGDDVAEGVVYVLSTPEHVQVAELTIRPVGEPY